MTPVEQAQADFATFTTSFNALVADNMNQETQIATLTNQLDTLQSRVNAITAILTATPEQIDAVLAVFQ